MRLQVDTRKEKRRTKNAAVREKISNYWGKEPNLDSWPLTNDIFLSSLVSALAWYNNSFTIEEMKKYSIEYLQEIGTPKDKLEVYKAAEDRCFNTLGSLCRMYLQGMVIPEGYEEYLDEKMEQFFHRAYENGKKILSEKKKEELSKYERIQEAVNSRRRFLIGLLETEVDNFILGKRDFSMKEFLFEREIAPSYASMILEKYEKMLNEIRLSLSGDKEYSEAYSNFKKTDLVELRDFIQNIVNTCIEYISGSKQQKIRKPRKPRKIKEKDPTKVTVKMKYKASIPEFKIVSVSPDKILKSESVWLFDTQYRYLTHLVAKPTGFVIRGTTVFDFDESKSTRKKIRKPEQVLTCVVNNGKVALRKLMDTIKSKPQKVTGRLNENTVIVRVD
jgi:hypothetical protein